MERLSLKGSDSDLIYVMYTSSANHLMTGDELIQLLLKCRKNNRRNEITGMLLYNDGNFVQVLEGPEENVERLLRTIEADPRHKGILELLRGELTERQFGDWEMGFRNVAELSPSDRAEVSDFLGEPGADNAGGETPHESRKLLRIFQRLMG